jgi:hypothetical protein
LCDNNGVVTNLMTVPSLSGNSAPAMIRSFALHNTAADVYASELARDARGRISLYPELRQRSVFSSTCWVSNNVNNAWLPRREPRRWALLRQAIKPLEKPCSRSNAAPLHRIAPERLGE